VKKRCAVIRLLHDGYLTRSGSPSNLYAAPRLVFRYEDAQTLLSQMCSTRGRDYGNPWFGASIEVLPKRKRHTPLTEEEFKQFLADLRTHRALGEAAKYERMAEAKISEASYAMKQAAEYRARAKQIQEELKHGT